MTPLELNAHLLRLIESDGHDEEARHAVVEAAARMQPDSPVKYWKKTTTTSRGGQLTGHADIGHDVMVNLKNGETETKEISWGDKSLRIGHFKLSCQKSRRKRDAGQLRSLTIRHFWKADPGTRSETETPEEWLLQFDAAGQPEYFAKISEPVKLWSLASFTMSQLYAVVTWSRDGKLERKPYAKVLERRITRWK